MSFRAVKKVADLLERAQLLSHEIMQAATVEGQQVDFVDARLSHLLDEMKDSIKDEFAKLAAGNERLERKNMGNWKNVPNRRWVLVEPPEEARGPESIPQVRQLHDGLVSWFGWTVPVKELKSRGFKVRVLKTPVRR